MFLFFFLRHVYKSCLHITIKLRPNPGLILALSVKSYIIYSHIFKTLTDSECVPALDSNNGPCRKGGRLTVFPQGNIRHSRTCLNL